MFSRQIVRFTWTALAALYAVAIVSAHAAGPPQGRGRPPGGFHELWTSGSDLYGAECLTVGDIDADGFVDFVGHNWLDKQLLLYETDGRGGFSEVGRTSPHDHGAFHVAAYGDSDGDGVQEIIAARVAMRPSLFVYERSPEPDAYTLLFSWYDDAHSYPYFDEIVELFVTDADGNGRQEIIVVADLGFDGGIVIAGECSGSGDSHHFREIGRYRVPIRIFSAALGDVDHDGCADIVLAGPGYDQQIFRLEHDPARGMWEYKTHRFEVPGNGWQVAVSDIDRDGEDEILYANTRPKVEVVVIESEGDDEFHIERRTEDDIPDENVRAIAVLPPREPGYRHWREDKFGAVAVYSYHGQVTVWEVAPNHPEFRLLDRFATIGHGSGELAFLDTRYRGGLQLIVATSGREVVYHQSGAIASPACGPAAREAAIRIAPNPFNPRTTVSFSTESTARVRVGVYDLRGRLLTELANGESPPGSHSIEWSGRDMAGLPLPSGEYLFRVERGGEVAIERAVLVR